MKLTAHQSRVLGEVRRATDDRRCYWWRPKTMAVLQELGLVESYTPPSVAERPRMKARPWRITPAGRAALQAHGEVDRG